MHIKISAIATVLEMARKGKVMAKVHFSAHFLITVEQTTSWKRIRVLTRFCSFTLGNNDARGIFENIYDGCHYSN